MFSLFDEIQQRAEKLNADIRLGAPTEFRLAALSQGKEYGGGVNASVLGYVPPPMLEASLDEIFRRSEEIWNKKQSLRPVLGMGVTLRAIKDQSQLSSTKLADLAKRDEHEKQQQQEKQFEYDDFGKEEEAGTGQFDDEIGKYVQRAFERARIAAERTFLNQQVLERGGGAQNLSGAHPSRPAFFRTRRGAGEKSSVAAASLLKRIHHPEMAGNLPGVPLADVQNVFGQKINSALSNDSNSPLEPELKKAVKQLNTREADYIWSKVFSVFPSSKMRKANQTIRQLRSDKCWLDHFIEAGGKYLQEEFKAHMESTIESNLAAACRGGVPGTLSLIDAYLKVKRPPRTFKYEDNQKWILLFYCLRIGDINSASKVAEELSNNPQCSALVSILTNLPRLASIDDEKRVKMRAEWKQNAQACTDPFKSAVYGLFLGFDCVEANTTTEDWLWARLFTCKYAMEPTRALRQLQTTICAQHGERYFVVEGGSYLLYYSVLLLTGQIERAVFVLHKSSEYSVHAVHIALLAHQLDILMCTDSVSNTDILVQDVHEPSICQLNLARLVLLYVKDFEMANPGYALDYCFFLRDFQLEQLDDDGYVSSASGGRTVFDACVSRMVFLVGSEGRDAILGQFNQRGERVRGLIDRFGGSLTIEDVIARVAFDISVEGDVLGACQLYALANRLDDAIQLICGQLSKCIAKPSAEPTTIRAVECAEWLARRYEITSPNSTEQQQQIPSENLHYTTLCQLQELFVFFRLAEAGKHRAAIEQLQKMRFIPTDPEDVQAAVEQFHLVPEELRPLLPAICSELMRAIVGAHEQAPQGSPETLMLKQFSKALILYTAMIPFRFPVSTNSLLLQLRSKIV